MERVSLAGIEPDPGREDVERRRLSDPLGATGVAVNRYRVPPGERLAGLHAHADQEELFLVSEGSLTFETLDGRVPVAAGEAVRFAPGEFQSGCNDGDEPAVVLAVGAPRDGGDLRVPLGCPDCGHEELRPDVPDGGDPEPVLVCPDCGAEWPADCPDCGSFDVRAVLDGDGEPVSCCGACGSEWADVER